MKDDLWPHEMAGCRQGLGTQDEMLRHDIMESRSRHDKVLSLDLTKAFDNTIISDWRVGETLLGLEPSSKYERATTIQAMSTQHMPPVNRGYDPESMQVQETQLDAPSSAKFLPHYEAVLGEMRRNHPGTRTLPMDAETLTTTSCATGAIPPFRGWTPQENRCTTLLAAHMARDEYVVIIKPRQTCNLKQYRGTGSIGNAIRAAISQRSVAAEVSPNLTHQYSLLWKQNLVIVSTKDECVLLILLSLEQLRLTDKTIRLQAYHKATDNMGKRVIRLTNTFTTDYILANWPTPPRLTTQSSGPGGSAPPM
ncbi:hypothetical protein HPB51_012897 [Rhipicephalus microplus]|uniref:Uncharacterized protein n=1 Tax=Rhipicephalus microplus TaxID=6941 RepID=A0A9J6EGU0_RHIMP|nr:hypothetical protein HPB51_012897 [Rhipicephalus microplus]